MAQTYTDELLRTLETRLQHLELQAASYGLDTPPHVRIEIDSLVKEIELTKLRTKSIISEELLDRMEPRERWKRLYDAIWEVEIILYSLQKNADNDRLNIQKRHKEFNMAIQNIVFENELLKRGQSRLYIYFGVAIVVVILALFLWAILT